MIAKLRARLGRAFFVLTHFLVGTPLAAIGYGLSLVHPALVANYVMCLALYFKEFGELAKEAKDAGNFKNSAKENIALAKLAFSDDWIRAQWLHPTLALSVILVVAFAITAAF